MAHQATLLVGQLGKFAETNRLQRPYPKCQDDDGQFKRQFDIYAGIYVAYNTIVVTEHKTEIQLSACGGRLKLRLLVDAVAAAQNHNQIAVLLINHMQYVLTPRLRTRFVQYS